MSRRMADSGGRADSGGGVLAARSGGDGATGWVVVENRWVGLAAVVSHHSG
jgi:hypothetical protein